MTLDFLTNLLSVPSVSGHEEFLAEAIEQWCRKAGVKVRKDGMGNMYLTKGAPKAGEFYPGATAHIDTAQTWQLPYVQGRMLLEPEVDGDTISMYMRDERGQRVQTGTGSDDKNAVAIILSLFARVPVLKAAFYVQEEVGCRGVEGGDWSFWDDVAWVFGCDSPGPGSRMTKTCSGTRLYSDGFFDQWLGPVCSRHGVTDARHEPYTDVMHIRRHTRLECCNINNGGSQSAHTQRETASYKETCATEELGYELITTIPCGERHLSDVTEERPQYSWSGGGAWGGWASAFYGGGYGGYGRSTGGSRRSGGGRRIMIGSHAVNPARPAMFRWKFAGGAEAARSYADVVKAAVPEAEVDVDGAEAATWATADDMRLAWISAYNIDNGESLGENDIDDDRQMSKMFADAVELLPEIDHGHVRSEKCAVAVEVEAGGEAAVEKAVADCGQPVEVDAGEGHVTLSGKLGPVKAAYAAAFAAVNGSDPKSFAATAEADSGFEDGFWKLVHFSSAFRQAEFDWSRRGDVEDAEYTMKGQGAAPASPAGTPASSRRRFIRRTDLGAGEDVFKESDEV